MPTLQDLADAGLTHFDIHCDKCGRRGRYRITTLIRMFGPTGDPLVGLSADCPRRLDPPAGWYGRCDPMSPTYLEWHRKVKE